MKKGGRTLPSFYPFAGSANGRFDHCMSGDAEISSGQNTHENLGQPHSLTSLLLSRRAYHALCVGGSCVHVRSMGKVRRASTRCEPARHSSKSSGVALLWHTSSKRCLSSNSSASFIDAGQGKITSGMFPPPRNGVCSTSARPMREIADCQRDN